VSPFNEPQWDWAAGKSGNASQEGTPINNIDISWAVKKLDEGIRKKGLQTKIVIPEAGQLDYLYQKIRIEAPRRRITRLSNFSKLKVQLTWEIWPLWKKW